MFTDSITNIIVGVSAFLLGTIRAGINIFAGTPTPVLILAISDPKEAAGIITIVAFISDCIAILYYRKKVDISILKRMLPLVLLGMFFAFIFGGRISTLTYLVIITVLSAVAIIPIAIHQWNKHKPPNKNTGENKIQTQPTNKHARYRHFFVLISCGIIAGIGTAMGNMANIFLNLYLSELRIQKTPFIATAAWFYFIVNAIKIYFHLTYWKSISIHTIVSVLPFALLVGIGFIFGIYIIKRTSEKLFSAFILLSSIIPFIILLKRTLDVLAS